MAGKKGRRPGAWFAGGGEPPYPRDGGYRSFGAITNILARVSLTLPPKRLSSFLRSSYPYACMGNSYYPYMPIDHYPYMGNNGRSFGAIMDASVGRLRSFRRSLCKNFGDRITAFSEIRNSSVRRIGNNHFPETIISISPNHS